VGDELTVTFHNFADIPKNYTREKGELKISGVVKILYCGGGGAAEHDELEGSQSSPARPSGRSSMEVNVYKEDVRMATVVA
jgi:hypothetical protein